MSSVRNVYNSYMYNPSGTISRDEIRAVLQAAGEAVEEAEIDEMLNRVDIDGDGNISIEGRSGHLFSN